jgi:hypothetical protein
VKIPEGYSMQPDDRNRYDLRRDILPIVVVKREGYPTPKGFKGTGFLIGKNVFVTCSHRVSDPIKEDETYGVAFQREYAGNVENDIPGAQYAIRNLHDIEHDPTGLDLATARIGSNPVGLTLREDDDIAIGEDVWTFGFALTEGLPHPERGRAIAFRPRFLKGYSTVAYINDVPGYKSAPGYELDMPAPRGLSGSPLVRLDSKDLLPSLSPTCLNL